MLMLAFSQAFFPKGAHTEKAIEALAMFFYTTETPFHKVESEFLKQAFMCLGCKIPARRELAGKYLEAAYLPADLTVLRKGTNMHIREVTKLHKHITGIPVYIYIIYCINI